MNSKILFLCFLLVLFSCSEHKRNNTANSTVDIERQADSLYYAKNDVLAIPLYSKLISEDSTKGKYYLNRGYSYTILLNAYPAIQDFLKSIQLNYRVAESNRNIAVNYFSIDDSLAVYYINKSYQLNPNDSSVKNLKQKYEMQLIKDKLNQ
ncbi:MAG: hypothetical protein WAU24_10305 [Chitinophagaceae bacterium]